ncbi:hypothetical protein [Methylocapsa palsarum]|uniref:Uncharacterized protein n=1 Tax=Methylocapsa palsarum TaxID=1612308 RepID=A0A1I4CND8_9HYPH|nr:hypothetical protein [Methylocapsa palsarum]SFK82784.1 hypothetical protein SAMN05444581_12619 [Methylocapsa palsarum]
MSEPERQALKLAQKLRRALPLKAHGRPPLTGAGIIGLSNTSLSRSLAARISFSGVLSLDVPLTTLRRWP